LDLARDISGSEEGHLAVFGKFEEVGLNAATGDIASAFAAGRSHIFAQCLTVFSPLLGQSTFLSLPIVVLDPIAG
jgi:hypothetical protein